MKLFDSFKTSKELISKTQFVNVYSVKCDDKEYTVIFARRIANKHKIIHFIDNTIYWEQIPRFPKFSGHLYADRIPIYKFNSGKVSNTIFVVKGTPLGDEGVDNGMCRSPRKYDENFVNCITYKRFKNM